MTVADSPVSPAAVVDRFRAGIESGAMSGGVFSDDGGLDGTVPNWRFQLRGGEAVRAELARWYDDPGHFLDLQRTPMSGGELVEFTLSWLEEGLPRRCHQAHILRVAGDRVAMDTAFCGGRWTADLIEEMEMANAQGADR